MGEADMIPFVANRVAHKVESTALARLPLNPLRSAKEPGRITM